MGEWNERWQKMVADLEQERDELRLKMHLAKEDAKDEWAKLEPKLDAKIAELKTKAAALDKDGDGSISDDVGDATRKLAAEVKDGFQKLRQKFQSS